MIPLALRISAEAYRDLELIWAFTAERGSLEQTDRYYSLIIEEFEFLRRNASSGKSAESIRAGYRVSFVKSHAIFYKVSDSQELQIIRILHQHQNMEKWLE